MKPFIRWVGGKRKHVPRIKELMPKTYVDYYEPFVGGGAVLFELQPKTAIINDVNNELMTAYKVLSDPVQCSMLIEHLASWDKEKSEEFYLSLRAEDTTGWDPFAIAARFIFLNRTCFNGLYRLNKEGKFNVIYDKRKLLPAYNAYDESTINSVSSYLMQNNIICLNTSNYSEVIDNAKDGDFILIDPPYDKYENQNNFSEYGNTEFTKDDQINLALKLWEISSKKKVKIMIFNYNTPLIRELYDGMFFHSPTAELTLTQEGAEEIIITNYNPMNE